MLLGFINDMDVDDLDGEWLINHIPFEVDSETLIEDLIIALAKGAYVEVEYEQPAARSGANAVNRIRRIVTQRSAGPLTNKLTGKEVVGGKGHVCGVDRADATREDLGLAMAGAGTVEH